MAKKGSSRRWLAQHHRDAYVKSARNEGYRSRAAYKLIEIDDRDHILHKEAVVVELGAAPGGWSQVVRQRIGEGGRLLMVDLLPLVPLPGAEFVQGDFTDPATIDTMRKLLGDSRVDLVLSDMAPNLCGIRSIDQSRSMALAEAACAFAECVLNPGGTLLLKVFQGGEVSGFVKVLSNLFRSVAVRKPNASRSRSGEIYMLAKGYGL